MDHGSFARDAEFQTRLARQVREYDAIRAGLTEDRAKLLSQAWNPLQIHLTPDDQELLFVNVRVRSIEWRAVDDAWNDATWDAFQENRWRLAIEASWPTTSTAPPLPIIDPDQAVVVTQEGDLFVRFILLPRDFPELAALKNYRDSVASSLHDSIVEFFAARMPAQPSSHTSRR